MRQTQFVVAGYIFHQDKLLLLYHTKLQKWLPVGGHIDEHEIPDDALLREIKEETNLNVEIISDVKGSLTGDVIRNLHIPFHVNVHNVGDHDHCCFFYLCRALNLDELRINIESEQYKWFSIDELDERVPKDVNEIARLAFSLIRQKS